MNSLETREKEKESIQAGMPLHVYVFITLSIMFMVLMFVAAFRHNLDWVLNMAAMATICMMCIGVKEFPFLDSIII